MTQTIVQHDDLTEIIHLPQLEDDDDQHSLYEDMKREDLQARQE
jgi:hypothetical protein